MAKQPQPHPAAAVWPMLPEDELQALADSITEVGLLEPVVRWTDPDSGEVFILDGRNRLAACKLANARPKFVDLNGDTDPVAFVAARNNERRHMKPTERAMAVAMMLVAAGRRNLDAEGNMRWDYGAVRNSADSPNCSSWGRMMRSAGVVLDFLPDLGPQVVNGQASLDAAYKQATDERERLAGLTAEAERRAENVAAMREQDLDLAARVDDGDLTPEEAVTLWEARHAEERDIERLAERDRRDAIDRQVQGLRNVLHGWSMIAHLAANPLRDDVLAELEPDERERVLAIEKGST